MIIIETTFRKVKLVVDEINRRLLELALYDKSSAGYIESEQEFLNNLLSRLIEE